MIKVLITGADSYVGDSVRRYILAKTDSISIDVVDTMDDSWRQADFSLYDVVYDVAGIAHVNPDPSMEPLYYKVNRDLTLAIAQKAKAEGVRQFIFMSSQIVFGESRSLRPQVITASSPASPNGFYGDSKLQAEVGLRKLDSDSFKVCILRPPLIYGVASKGNFPRLIALARRTPLFPAWHNRRSMIYVDNFAEFVLQAILREMRGTFFPQNREQSDTVEIIRFFARHFGRRVWISSLLNPFVWMASFVLQPVNKMFSTYYYDPAMSSYDFDYQLVSFRESLNRIAKYLSNT